MITLACLTCHLALQTSGDPVELDYLVGIRSDWYPDRYPCARSGCAGNMVLTDTIDPKALMSLEIHHLNPQETFQAIQGMGLPKERSCDEEMVCQLMVGKKVKSLELRGLQGTNRSILHSITLEDDCRIYIGSSPYGSIIYRMAYPRSIVAELEDMPQQGGPSHD